MGGGVFYVGEVLKKIPKKFEKICNREVVLKNSEKWFGITVLHKSKIFHTFVVLY